MFKGQTFIVNFHDIRGDIIFAKQVQAKTLELVMQKVSNQFAGKIQWSRFYEEGHKAVSRLISIRKGTNTIYFYVSINKVAESLLESQIKDILESKVGDLYVSVGDSSDYDEMQIFYKDHTDQDRQN